MTVSGKQSMVRSREFGVRSKGASVGFRFEELVVYRRSIVFADRIYSLTKSFPNDEKFGLISQIRRATVSIALNIAEGSSRKKKDFARFLDISRGSAHECVAILSISLMQKYIDKSVYNECKNELIEIVKMLSGLKKSLNID